MEMRKMREIEVGGSQSEFLKPQRGDIFVEL